jgi:hypothetical protein
MNSHPQVKHPSELLAERELSRLNNWVTDHLSLALGSVIGMYLALTIPLIALPIPAFARIVVIISSNWIQLWGLFCLQRSANRADARRTAKADADHKALTHIAVTIDSLAGKRLQREEPEAAAAAIVAAVNAAAPVPGTDEPGSR